MRRISLAAIGVAAVAAAAPVGSGHAASLRDALERTYRTNPDIEAARARVRQTNERVPQAYGSWKPNVSLSASTGVEQREEKQVTTGRGVTNSTTVSNTLTPDTFQLQLRQPIYQGGSNFAQLNRAQRRVSAERHRLGATTQETLLRGVRAYLNVWRDQKLVEFSEGNVQALKDLLDAAKKRLERGVNTKTDVVQARSRLARGRRRLENFRGQLRRSRATYRQIIGSEPGTVSYPEVVDQLPKSAKEAAGLAAEKAPSVQAARQSARAAEQQVRQRLGRLLPSLSIRGNASRRTDTDDSIVKTRSAQVTINLQLPLYQQGIATSQVRQAKQTANERQLRAVSATRQAKQQARSAWAQLQAARQRVKQAKVEVDTSKETLEGLRKENRVGTRTVQDVLDGQRDLFQARIAFARARRDLALARFRLLNATGQLTPSRLGLDVKAYDPSAAYKAVRDTWWSLDAPKTDVDAPAVFPFNNG